MLSLITASILGLGFVQAQNTGILCKECDVIKQDITQCVSDELTNENYDTNAIEYCCKKQSDKIKILRQEHPVLDKIETYDITINKKWSFIKDLKNKWEIQLSDDILAKCKEYEPKTADVDDFDFGPLKKCLADAMVNRGCYVGFIGGFNKGKTHIINSILRSKFPHGYDEDGETKGINFILPNAGNNIIFDTPGALRSVSPASLQDRYMTDRFVEDLVPDLGDVIVLVVNILTSDEQVLIKKLMKDVYKYSTKGCTKELVIIHNYKNLGSIKSVESHIQTDIVTAFSAKLESVSGIPSVMYVNYFGNDAMKVSHFIIGRDGSPSGVKYNKDTYNLLRLKLTFCLCHHTHNIVNHVISRLEPLLRKYFPTPPAGPNENTEGGGKGWNVYELLITGIKYMIGSGFYEEKVQKNLNTKGLRLDKSTRKLIENRDKDPFRIHWDVSYENNKSNIIMKLKNDNPLEACKSKDFGKPKCRPEPSCRVDQSDNIFLLTCGLPNAMFGNSKQMNEAIYVKMDANAAELYVYGTLKSPVNRFKIIDPDLEVVVQDAPDEGFVPKVYQVDNLVALGWSERKQIYKRGVLMIAVPIVQKEYRDDMFNEIWNTIVAEFEGLKSMKPQL